MSFLNKNLQKNYKNKSIAVLFSAISSKLIQAQEIAKIVEGFSQEVIITNFEYSQDKINKSINAQVLAKFFTNKKPIIKKNIETALDTLLKSNCEILLVTGSLYLVGEIKKYLQPKY